MAMHGVALGPPARGGRPRVWVHGRSRPAGARDFCARARMWHDCVAACNMHADRITLVIMVAHDVHVSARDLLQHLRVGAGGRLRPSRAPHFRASPCASTSSGQERGGCPSPHFLNGPSEAQLAQFDETKYKILSRSEHTSPVLNRLVGDETPVTGHWGFVIGETSAKSSGELAEAF